MMRRHIGRISTVLQSGTQRTTYCPTKTKELIIDFRKKEAMTHIPVYISGAEVEQMNSFRFLGIGITKNLLWTSHISTLVKKAQKHLNFLRKLKGVVYDSNPRHFLSNSVNIATRSVSFQFYVFAVYGKQSGSGRATKPGRQIRTF